MSARGDDDAVAIWRKTVPEGLRAARPDQLKDLISALTVIEIPGAREPPILVSGMLHGNEPAGLWAIQRLLERYQHQKPPRTLLLMLGNVAAAARGVRRLDDGPDYNRVWRAGLYEAVDRLHARIGARGLFCTVDIHNNTGRNPYFSVVTELAPATLHLAQRFARHVVYAPFPDGPLAKAMAAFAPALTLECGQPRLKSPPRQARREPL